MVHGKMYMWKHGTNWENHAGKQQSLREVYKTLSDKPLVISRALLQDVFTAPKAAKKQRLISTKPINWDMIVISSLPCWLSQCTAIYHHFYGAYFILKIRPSSVITHTDPRRATLRAGLSLGFNCILPTLLYTLYPCIFLPCDQVLSLHIFPDQKTDWVNICHVYSAHFWGIFQALYLRSWNPMISVKLGSDILGHYYSSRLQPHSKKAWMHCAFSVEFWQAFT